MTAKVITLPVATDAPRMRQYRAGRCRQADILLRALRSKAVVALGIADEDDRRAALRHILRSLCALTWPAVDADGAPTGYAAAVDELSAAIARYLTGRGTAAQVRSASNH